MLDRLPRSRLILRAFMTCGLLVALGLYTSTPAAAKPAAGKSVSAEQSICQTWGFSEKIKGLCNSYCDALDCDAANGRVWEDVCGRLYGKIVAALPSNTPFPTCKDTDADRIPDGLDNFPSVANPLQENVLGMDFGSAQCPCEGLTVGQTTYGPAFVTALCTLFDSVSGFEAVRLISGDFEYLFALGDDVGITMQCWAITPDFDHITIALTREELVACQAVLLDIAAQDGVACVF